jgi:threonine dehydrogenase-like Zn-dependent dehydrogenase
MRWHTRNHMALALRWMSEGRLDVLGLTTHKLPLADIDVAVTAHIEAPDKTMGTVLVMSH